MGGARRLRLGEDSATAGCLRPKTQVAPQTPAQEAAGRLLGLDRALGVRSHALGLVDPARSDAGLRQFCALPESEWRPLLAIIRGERPPLPWEGSRLQFIGPAPRKAITAPVVGGNLSVWTSLIGTPYACRARGKIVFFEDVDENLYRVDRMVQQVIASGSLKGARAVVLGNFLGCRDIVSRVLSAVPQDPKALEKAIREPDPAQLVPLRPPLEPGEALAAIFSEITRHCRIPVASGLPVGHGPGKAPLPLGARYELTARGELRLLGWDWPARA